jgi:conjugative transposon TraM protein
MSEMDKIDAFNKQGRLDGGKEKNVSNFETYKGSGVSNGYPNIPKANVYTSKKDYNSTTSRDFESYNRAINAASNPPKAQPKNRFDEEMALFKAQMSMIDSMTNKTGAKNKTIETTDNFDKTPINKGSEVANIEIKEVKKAGLNNQNYFNTLGESRQNSFIKAILDEGLKVYDGSRVRIRLMDDIVVDNTPHEGAGSMTLSKGSYLFGVIHGFAPQRVFITITNIVYDSHITPVKLDVYDYDGMKGLYIPESLFREIAKDAGAQVAGSNITFSNGQGVNATQLAYQAVQDVYRSSTRAMSAAIRSRKAILKYNTMIYLVNGHEK